MPSELQPESTSVSDVLIAGAGIIGLSLALELRRRGASVTVLERANALGGASSAAAGMLAAEDPHNPPALLLFSRYSLALYPEFLVRIQSLSGMEVPVQTDLTVQHAPSGIHHLVEHSLDPRQLGPALLAAARAASVRIVEHTPIADVQPAPDGIEVQTAAGTSFRASHFVHASGAWSLPGLKVPLFPRKGQMLRVAMPSHAPLREVHRAEHVYVVPRTSGPQAGTALVGATVEDAGFDLCIDADSIEELRKSAAELAPETAFIANAPMVEAWAGVRPCTPDLLPLMGQLGDSEWIASGHFRNGILLAPGTAAVMADLLTGRGPQVDIHPFLPARFAAAR